MCLTGDSVQPEHLAQVRDPETGDWEGSTGDALTKDFDHEPTTDLDYLKNLGEGSYERNAFSPPLDHFSGVTFQNALDNINPTNRTTAAGRDNRCVLPSDIKAHDGQAEIPLMDVADLTNVGGSDLASKWGTVQSEVVRVTQDFNRALDSLKEDKEHWDGKTKLEAFANVRQSFVAPEKISASAGGMQILVDAFWRTIDYVYKNIEGNRPNYEYNVQLTHDEDHDEYVKQFNDLAQKVLGHYSDNIQTIAANNPHFTTGKLPELGGPPPPDPQKQALGQGLGNGDLGGGPVPNFGTPRMPDLGDSKLPTVPKLPTTPPTGLDDPPGLPEGVGDPTQAASNAVPPSPSSAGGAPQSTTGLGKDPREGALGLGPKGLGGPLKKAGGSGGAGGGAGRGPLGAKPVSGKPATAPVTSAGRAGIAGATPSAGLGAGAGAPGMMPPPVAGQRGDSNGKGHQTMKALRRKKTGEQVMGKADAVVPVVGGSERPEPSQPEPEDDVQPDRRRVADQPVQRIATGDLRQVP
jgi:hypothetical protein